jgi:hypothetical protein
LTKQRAQSVAAIFRLSGLKQDRLMLRGMGGDAARRQRQLPGPCAEPSRGNHVHPAYTMLALLSKYQPGKHRQWLKWLPCRMFRHRPPKPRRKGACRQEGPAKKAAAKPATKKAPAKPAAKAAPAKAKAADPANDQAKN